MDYLAPADELGTGSERLQVCCSGGSRVGVCWAPLYACRMLVAAAHSQRRQAGRPATPPATPPAATTHSTQDESAAYFSELLSYSLERLGKEPELLRADQDALRRQLQDTTVGRYRSFIDVACCLGDLRTQLAAAGHHLDDLARDLPKLQAACDSFRTDAAAVAAARAANRQLYATHPTVLEVLEVPQLMDTCCRSGNYDEALDLRAFVNKVRLLAGLLCWRMEVAVRCA